MEGLHSPCFIWLSLRETFHGLIREMAPIYLLQQGHLHVLAFKLFLIYVKDDSKKRNRNLLKIDSPESRGMAITTETPHFLSGMFLS